MIEVFKTNINDPLTAITIREALSLKFPEYQFNFDLDDCDNILRVNGHQINHQAIFDLVSSFGHFISILEE